MAQQGPLSPGTIVNDAAPGGIPWTSPAFAADSNDNWATAALNGESSQYILATNFGFSIPSGSTIDGIVIEVEKSVTGSGLIGEYEVVVIRGGGSPGTSVHTGAVSWTGTDTYDDFDTTPTSLHGLSWTDVDTDINVISFGFRIGVWELDTVAATARIDHMRVTVYYTEGSPPLPPIPLRSRRVIKR